MKHRPSHLVFVVAATVFGAWLPCSRAQDPPAVSNTEPPLSMFLEVDGEELPIEFDQARELAPGAANGARTVVLRCRPWRQLVLPGLTVRYPREYHFECERDESSSSWTLTGADATLMLVLLPVAPAKTDAAVTRAFANMLKEQYGERARDGRIASLRLDGVDVAGLRVRAQITDSIEIVQDVHAHVHADGSCTVLVIQHTPQDGGSEPAEASTLRQQVVETLRWSP